MRVLKVIPAILSADRKDFKEKLSKFKNFSLIQVDICDGKFVANKTVQPNDFEGIKDLPKIEFHLMVRDVEHYVEHFVRKNAETIIFHFEACMRDSEVLRIIRHIKDHNINVGIAMNPETSIIAIKKFLKYVDQVLVMTVHPGLQGQKFIIKMLDKVKALRKLAPALNIEVDGGVNEETILLAKKAGANLFVVGSAIMNARNPKNAFEQLSKQVNA